MDLMNQDKYVFGDWNEPPRIHPCNSDSRSKFANDVCRVIYKKNKGDFFGLMNDTELFYNHFNENVRNFYELVSCSGSVPLFVLYYLLKFGPQNCDFTEEVFNEAVQEAKKACQTFYF